MTPGRLSVIFRQALSVLGGAVFVALVFVDTSWVERWREVLALMGAAFGLRAVQLAVGKYAYVSQSGAVGLAGALLMGPAPTALALAVGTFFGDWAWFRKEARAAWVNSARELVAVLASFGGAALVFRWSGISTVLDVEAVPGLTTYVVSYFVLSRALFYYTLFLRGKLTTDEQLFLLRYEIAGFGVTLWLAAAIVVTVAWLPPLAWPLVAAPVVLIALLANRILQEAIQAEELNKINAMESVIMGSVRLEDTLPRLEELAHRVLDWRDFRVYRRDGGALHLLYQGRLGSSPGDAPPAIEDLREEVITVRERIVLHDVERDSRTLHLPAAIQSLVIEPMLFGSELIGALELDHHKRHVYELREQALIETCARRVATAVHIADLRRPLVETVERIGRQVSELGRLASDLRAAVDGMTHSTEEIRGSLAEQDAEVESGLAATHRLSESTRRVVEDSSGAAAASGSASETAERHRATIAGAIERLIELRAFVGEGSARVSDLGAATRRIVRFLESIRELADLTNLLALNAAIEAARAGKHGKGFAEVAREVKMLAAESSGAAADAGRLVEEIETRLSGVVEQMRRGQAQVEGVEETSTAGLQALDAIVAAARDATDHARRIADTAGGQEEAFGALRERIAGVSSLSTRSREGATVVSQRAKEVAGSVELIGRATQELDAIATMLADLTRRVTSVNGGTAF
jgi:methyl-accepting chemotaxis protein